MVKQVVESCVGSEPNLEVFGFVVEGTCTLNIARCGYIAILVSSKRVGDRPSETSVKLSSSIEQVH
jgi:hypothetical protein